VKNKHRKQRISRFRAEQRIFHVNFYALEKGFSHISMNALHGPEQVNLRLRKHSDPSRQLRHFLRVLHITARQ
jgi:hypothetical protein